MIHNIYFPGPINRPRFEYDKTNKSLTSSSYIKAEEYALDLTERILNSNSLIVADTLSSELKDYLTSIPEKDRFLILFNLASFYDDLF